MGITAAQRERRRTGLGASDVPALFGMHPFKNERDVWASKVYDLAPDEKESEAMDLGKMLEDPLIDWCREQVEHTNEKALRIRKNHEQREGPLLCHLDAKFLDEPWHIEAKTTGLTDLWGETSLSEPTGNVPGHVVLQAHAQMIVANTTRCLVPVLMWDFKWPKRHLYEVVADQWLLEHVYETCDWWWGKYVKGKVEPMDGRDPPQLDTLKRMRREPGTWGTIDPRAILAWENSKKKVIDLEFVKDLAKRELISAMENAEGLRPDMTVDVGEEFSDACADLPELTYFTRKGSRTFGKSKEHDTDKCAACGVGVRIGKDTRELRSRKRTG